MPLPARAADDRDAPPATGAAGVARPRLDALLDAGRDLPLTLVVACAGSGKRLAVRGWLARRRLDAVWVPASVPGGASAAVARAVAGARLRAIADDPASLDAALQAAADAAATPVRLVLDAAGPLAPDAAALLDALLADPHPRLRLLLLARAMPPLPTARLRLAGHLRTVGPDDLAFTVGEVEALLGRRGRPGPLARRIVAETEGWAAGVAALARSAVAPGDDPCAVPDLERGHRWLDAFVREEVLAPLAPDLRDALVRTAPFDLVGTGDVEAVLGLSPGGGRPLLDRLLAADLARAAGTDGAVRVRSVLRPVLRERLGTLPAAEARPVAERLVAVHGDARAEEALRLLLAVGDVDGAAALLGRLTDALLAREAWTRLEALLACFPESAAATRPEPLVARLWIAHLTGRFVAIREVAERIAALDAALPADDPGRVARAALTEVLGVTSLVPLERDPDLVLARQEGIADRFPAAARQARGMSELNVALALHAAGRGAEAVDRLTVWTAREADRADAAYARGVQALCFVHWQAGNLAACRQAAEQLLAVADARDLPLAAGWARRFLGRLDHEQGRPREAAAWYRPVVDDPRAHHACRVEAVVGLALCLGLLGEPEEGRRRLAEAMSDAARERAVHLLAVLRAADGLLAVRSGASSPGEGVRATVGASIDDASLHAAVQPLAARTELLLRDGSAAAVAEAARHVATLRQRAVGSRHLPAAVLAETLAAALALRQGDGSAARATLARAAGLGLPAGLRQTFLDLAPLLRPLALGRAAAAAEGSLAEALALVAIGPGPAAPPRPAPAPPRPAPLALLTVREAEVLALAGRGLTYAEIADALSVSASTVKFHLGSVYGKLGVSGRRQALLRAAALGWDLAAPER